jgi:tetratricopeptide (TPR) repeat protein
MPQPVEVVDPVAEFMMGRSHPPLIRVSFEDVPQNVDGLKRLALARCWKQAITLCEHCIYNLPLLPHESLQWQFALAFSLVKLERPGEAAEVIDKHVGPFNADKNRFETYAAYYPGQKGCMIPFGMRLLHAKLPLLRNDPKASQDRLYELLDFCQEHLNEPDTAAAIKTAMEQAIVGDAAPNTWRDRERCVKLELVDIHVSLYQHMCAVAIINDMLKEYTPEMRTAKPTGQAEYMELLQRLGGIHLEAGQLGPAEDAYSRVEAIDETILSPADQHKLEVTLCLNRGTLCMAQSRFARAFEEFGQVLQKDSHNAEAANNQAVCALYNCNLKEAVSILEGLIRNDPHAALTEPVVFNLCTLYDLQSEQNLQKKKVLHAVVQRFKGDHFPQKYLKLE